MSGFGARAVGSRCPRWTIAAILSGFRGEGVAAEDRRRDCLVFVDASAMRRRGSPVGEEIKRDAGETRATFLYSWQRDRHRVFAEVHVAAAMS